MLTLPLWWWWSCPIVVVVGSTPHCHHHHHWWWVVALPSLLEVVGVVGSAPRCYHLCCQWWWVVPSLLSSLLLRWVVALAACILQSPTPSNGVLMKSMECLWSAHGLHVGCSWSAHGVAHMCKRSYVQISMLNG